MILALVQIASEARAGASLSSVSGGDNAARAAQTPRRNAQTGTAAKEKAAKTKKAAESDDDNTAAPSRPSSARFMEVMRSVADEAAKWADAAAAASVQC